MKWYGCLLTHGLPITSILFRIVVISRSLFIFKYLKNENYFVSFFFHLWNLHQILNIFKKKMIVIADVFPKLQTVKDLVRPLTIKRCFRTSFDSQHVKGYQTLVKSSWERFYHTFPSPWGGMIWNISPLLKFELPITSFLFKIVIISRFLFKCNCLKNQKHFLNFSSIFGI